MKKSYPELQPFYSAFQIITLHCVHSTIINEGKPDNAQNKTF